MSRAPEKLMWYEINAQLGGERAAYEKYFAGTLPDNLRDAFLEQCLSPQREMEYRIILTMEHLEKVLERIETKL